MTLPPIALHDSGGDKPAILFLHAYPLNADMWQPQIDALAGEFRCLRPEFWGCGSSPSVDSHPTLDEFADAVIDQIDAIGVDRFAVVGLSMGGYAAFAMLRRASARITHLVLAATKSGDDTDAARADRHAMADRVLAEGVGFLPEVMLPKLLSEAARQTQLADTLTSIILNDTPEGVAACLHAMAQRPDSTPQLVSIAVPTVVIAASADGFFPTTVLEEMAKAIPGARYQLIENAGHIVNLEAPEAFSAAIKELLGSPVSAA